MITKIRFWGIGKSYPPSRFFVNKVGSILSKGNAFGEFSLNEFNPKRKNVLNLILKDKTNKRIAEELGWSIKTIKFYRTSSYVKLNVKTLYNSCIKFKKWTIEMLKLVGFIVGTLLLLSLEITGQRKFDTYYRNYLKLH